MEEISLTEPLIAMVAGIILGPQVLEIIKLMFPKSLRSSKKPVNSQLQWL